MQQELILDENLRSAKNLARLLYLAHAATFLFSLATLSFIPLFVNYIKRGDTAGTFVHSHHTWQIRSFWWFAGWMVLGTILYFTIIGIPVAMLIMAIAWLWKAYRLIKGYLDLESGKPMPV